MTIVRRTSIDELKLEPNFKELTDEYAAESKIAEMPSYNLDINCYQQLEAAGIYHLFGAYVDDKLVGFIGVLVTRVPHYSVAISSTESFFVSAAYRKGGTGLKLLRTAEQCAKEQGAVILYCNAPEGGRLAKALPVFGYRESHRVFCRSLS